MSSRSYPYAFVPMDVDARHDDKIAQVSPIAELMYYRCLQWAKANWKTDGLIPTYALPDIGVRVRNRKLAMHELARTGLVQVHEQGWQLAAWLKRNKSAAEISAQKTEAGHLGNHKQGYHKDEPREECPACRKQRRNQNAPCVAPSDAETTPETETETERGTTYLSVSRRAGRQGARRRVDPTSPRPSTQGPNTPSSDWDAGQYRPHDYRYNPAAPHEGGWNHDTWHQPAQWRTGWAGNGTRPPASPRPALTPVPDTPKAS